MQTLNDLIGSVEAAWDDDPHDTRVLLALVARKVFSDREREMPLPFLEKELDNDSD